MTFTMTFAPNLTLSLAQAQAEAILRGSPRPLPWLKKVPQGFRFPIGGGQHRIGNLGMVPQPVPHLFMGRIDAHGIGGIRLRLQTQRIRAPAVRVEEPDQHLIMLPRLGRADSPFEPQHPPGAGPRRQQGVTREKARRGNQLLPAHPQRGRRGLDPGGCQGLAEGRQQRGKTRRQGLLHLAQPRIPQRLAVIGQGQLDERGRVAAAAGQFIASLLASGAVPGTATDSVTLPVTGS